MALATVSLVSSEIGMWWFALVGALLIGFLWRRPHGAWSAMVGIALGWAGILLFDLVVGRSVQGAAVVVGQVALLGSSGIPTYLLTLLSVVVISIPPWWFGQEVRRIVDARRSMAND